MLEGTTLSEGRGTTRPLEVLFGAPDVVDQEQLDELHLKLNLPELAEAKAGANG